MAADSLYIRVANLASGSDKHRLSLARRALTQITNLREAFYLRGEADHELGDVLSQAQTQLRRVIRELERRSNG